MKKSELALSALVEVWALFGKYSAMGTKIDTQESDFKAVMQSVAAAISAPEDKEPLPEIAVEQKPVLTKEDFDAGLAATAEKLKIYSDTDLQLFKTEVAEAVSEGLREVLTQLQAEAAAKEAKRLEEAAALAAQ